MYTLLTEKRDRALTRRWGIWLTTRDPERGLKVRVISLSDAGLKHNRLLQLLMTLLSGKRKQEDDRVLLDQIRDANPSAGAQFLEHLVLQKRNAVSALQIVKAIYSQFF